MTYKNTKRDLEAPDSYTGTYYNRQIRNWQQNETDVYFGYFDEERKKPALILECSDQDLRFNAKTAYALREVLKKNPKLLDNFIDGWLLANASPVDPSLGSSGSKKPKRLVPTRPK